LHTGIPVAVFERKGKVLRVFDSPSLSDTLRAFNYGYESRRLFPGLNRLTVKQYPDEAVDALTSAGFRKEMQDYVLYRGYAGQ